MIAVEHPGLYDLHDLGHDAPIVLTQRHRKSAFIPFRITEEAHRRYPYARVLLRFRIDISREARRGFGYVDMITGHGPSAMAEFVTRRRDDKLRIKWTTVDVNGAKRHNTTRRSIKVNYPNYMLFDDATAGKHRLRFKLEHYEGFRVERVTISPKSGIALTDRSPSAASVKVSARTLGTRSPVTGRPMTVVLRARNDSDRAATAVPVELRPDRGLRIVGADASTRWSHIAAHSAAERRVRIVPLTAGRHKLRIAVGDAGTRTSSGDLVFTAADAAGSRGADGGPPTWVWIALAAGILAAGTWRLRTVATS